jgi:hypothetical protein
LGYTLVAPVHHYAGRLGANQASVTALSRKCR